MTSRWTTVVLPALGLLLAAAGPAEPCSLCGGNLRQRPTFREDAALPSARIILIGTVTASDVKPDGTGTADLRVNTVIRSDPALAGRDKIQVGQYLPTDPKSPPRFLVFCDVDGKKIDPFRGVPVKSDEAATYVKKAVALDPRDRTSNLAFYFRSLEHPDPQIAQDAFAEFAKAADREIGQAAGKFDPDKLRAWLADEQTPPERLSLYALMLGACGRGADADLLGRLLRDTRERVTNAYDGILGGYIHLRPRDGWDLALSTLRDGRKPLSLRLAVVRTLRFYHGWQPKESRTNVLRGLQTMIAQGDLADLAVEDLRQWQMWDLTREVLGLYGKKGYDSQILQRAIIAYALSCDDGRCRSFLAERRRAEPDAVKEIEERLRAEKRK